MFSLCSVTRVEEELLKRFGVLFGFEVADVRKKSSRELVKGLLLVSPSAQVLVQTRDVLTGSFLQTHANLACFP